MHRIIITEIADQEIWNIYNYIAKDNPYYARIVTENIYWLIYRLAEFPKLWMQIDWEYQIIEPVYKYKVRYKIKRNCIYVVWVFKWQDR